MKSVRRICLALWLIFVPLCSLSEAVEALHSVRLWGEVPRPVVQKAPFEPFPIGDPPEAVTPLAPIHSVDPGEESLSASQEKGPVLVALIYVAPQEPSAEEYVGTIPDPIEPVNRAFFNFNDKLYFWVLKPVAKGYNAVVPEDARVGVRNFFSNVTTPVRLVNCLLQADFKCGGTETLRLLINSTFGLAGFVDLARRDFNLQKQDRDLGQTLGIYGIGSGFYINWPILGPSSVRDTVGYVGDLFLDPQTYLISSIPINVGIRAYYQVNETSLTLGEYEDLKKSALDPYIALKDAYYQYRQNKIRRR